MASGDAMETGVAMLTNDMASAVIPFYPTPAGADKRPYFEVLGPTRRRGDHPRTSDPAVVRQWWALWPDARLAIIPRPGVIVADYDRIDAAPPSVATYRERTRRGIHDWWRLANFGAISNAHLPGGAGDLIATNPVQITPTPGYEPANPDAPILPLPLDSPLWEVIRPRGTGATQTIVITPRDLRVARDLAAQIAQGGMFSEGWRALWECRLDWYHIVPATDISRSGRDWWLCFTASHFLRNHPRREHILAAMLQLTSEKAREHRDAQSYIAVTVRSAVSVRNARDADHVAAFVARFVPRRFLEVLPGDPKASGVLDPNLWDGRARLIPRRERARAIEATILHFADSKEDEFDRSRGWRRLPVSVVAKAFGVSGEAIRKHLVRLERQGHIERDTATYRHDGAVRRDSLVRLRPDT